jgi:hypothetical protein
MQIEETIYCDNEHNKKPLSRPDADTSGTQKKKQYCILNTSTAHL